MWIPKSEEEIVNAVNSGSLEETVIFDAKKELPSKSQEIAKDIAAMANDGGVLIYGIGEDEHKRLTILNPITLAGQKERVTSIVQTSIDEPPMIAISTVETDADPSKGYLIVAVPASERAPHMVVVKGDHRYYGRTATGNTPLSQAEVARLYERRRRWEVDGEALLAEEIKQSPFAPHHDFGFLHLVARPVSRDDGLLKRAARSEAIHPMLNDLIEFVKDNKIFPQRYDPDFEPSYHWHRGTEGFLGRLFLLEPKNPGEALDLQIDFDGTVHLFYGGAAERIPQGFLFMPNRLAAITTRFIALLGELCFRANYVGMVDLGLAITGIKGSWLQARSVRAYDRDDYKRTKRTLAIVFKDDPVELARELLMPLIDAMSQGLLDPFPKK